MAAENSQRLFFDERFLERHAGSIFSILAWRSLSRTPGLSVCDSRKSSVNYGNQEI